ncbi:DNAJ heat shock N-terminal domain-containing protein [Zea mays]|uniref:DNAJ heat shock N-terminal domain-containing protein n=1 Tax=Zea mays TaxID=4577 RepID=A0A1D6F295_MAIZE|nr:DNAJ heat shock N-terminal domain-containing protein [Zea mays]
MAMEIPAQVRRYWLPILLFTAGFLFQVLVLPRHFPPTHYDVLGVERFASVERVVEAYESLSKEWLSETSHQPTVDIIKIRYAYELLTNPVLKRDYDLFGLDEHKDVLERVKEQYQMVHFLKIDLPLLKDSVVSLIDDAFNVLTHESFMSAISEEYPLIILVYSKGSPRCAQFIEYWKQIGTQLDGIVRTAMVEVGDSQVAGYFAEKRFSKRPFFRNGVPTLVAYPANCKSPSCYMSIPKMRFYATPFPICAEDMSYLVYLRNYGSNADLYFQGPQFIGKSGNHKVKTIFFSSTGERAAPFVRQAAQEYSSYSSFGFVLWREDESQIWWNSLGVESAPALVFLKGPGTTPFVHHGKIPPPLKLRQLRSDTSLELGCDARGHSRAGNDAAIWYCVIVAGRPGAELSKKRQILRKAQDKLLGDVDRSAGNVDNSVETSSAATAFKDDRLTFVWLDGEVQKQICAFYLATDYTGACGPRDFGDDNDKPEIFIVRFQRNATYEALKAEKKNNLVDVLQGQHADASQLVARYKGPVEIEEINRWISQIIKDGDTREIPYFTSKVPDLVPEETSKAWNSKSIRSAGKSLKENIGFHFQDYLTHPMIGSTLLMCGCISMGILWFRNNTPTQSTRQEKARKDKAKRPRPKLSTSLFGEPSVPDVDPKDARQWEMSSSDSD